MAERTPDVRQNSLSYYAAQQQAANTFPGATIPPLQPRPTGDKQKWRHEKFIERLTSLRSQGLSAQQATNAFTGQNAVVGGAANQAAQGSDNAGFGQAFQGLPHFGPKLGPFG